VVGFKREAPRSTFQHQLDLGVVWFHHPVLNKVWMHVPSSPTVSINALVSSFHQHGVHTLHGLPLTNSSIQLLSLFMLLFIVLVVPCDDHKQLTCLVVNTWKYRRCIDNFLLILCFPSKIWSIVFVFGSGNALVWPWK